MTNELYTKLLQVLTLGHITYLSDRDELDEPEQFAVYYELTNMYKPEDMVEVIREFIRWYNDLEVENGNFPEIDEEDVEDIWDDYDWCYECTGYGDDYRYDEDGELVSACDDCPNNPNRGELWDD